MRNMENNMFYKVQRSRAEKLFCQIGLIVLSTCCMLLTVHYVKSMNSIQLNVIIQMAAILVIANVLLSFVLSKRTATYEACLYKIMNNFYEKLPIKFFGMKLGSYEKDSVGRIFYKSGSEACSEAEEYIKSLLLPEGYNI